jgi:hypothetical protein
MRATGAFPFSIALAPAIAHFHERAGDGKLNQDVITG